jgi:hypothetical protein
MYRYNFPGRKDQRRKEALARLKKQSARDSDHAEQIKQRIALLEEKIKANVS